MTNEQIRKQILAYRGDPFLINEYAQHLGITWNRMNRIVQKMVAARELRVVDRSDGRRYLYPNRYQVNAESSECGIE